MFFSRELPIKNVSNLCCARGVFGKIMEGVVSGICCE